MFCVAYKMQVFSLILCYFLYEFGDPVAADPFDVHVRNVKSGTSELTQATSAKEVIGRLIPERAQSFEVVVDFKRPRNSFRLLSVNQTIHITADSGVAACKGFYHYLKYHCGAHVSWDGQQLHSIPKDLPPVDVEVISPSTVVYFQNVCTWSYSYTWWQWTDWRRHIDWIAMSGITLTLAPFQEDVWREVYQELGLSARQIDEHLTGPGFFAWGRMGNIRGWGGPLSQNFSKSSSMLQKQIVGALRDLGISVALPSFAGHVPLGFRRLFPNASLVAVERWNRFPDQYCCPLFLDPVDPLFKRVGESFLNKMITKYGSNHIYFSDPFNEVQPHLAEADYLRNASRGIFEVMKTVDSEAVWLLQGWMFVKNPFWSDQLLEAFLTAVPQGRILVLDLMSEQEPQFKRTSSYFGQPFVWCMLHNFGGTLGMHGSVDKVHTGIIETSSNKSYTMVGVGVTPEGINQNYAAYEFALEMGWTPQNVSSVEAWFKNYPAVRYGKQDDRLSEAWRILQQTVYSYNGAFILHGKYTVCRRPSLKIYPFNWYNISDLLAAWELFLEASGDFASSTLFNRDLVDVSRQVLQNRADEIYLSIVELYKQKNMTELVKECNTFLDLLVDMDRILATHTDFLLGPFLESAKAAGSTEKEGLSLAFNAKNQITLWGPNGEISDYANKQWSGVILDYFYPRWHVFFVALEVAVKTNRKVNETEFRDRIFEEIELPFNVDNRDYPNYSRGNTAEVSREIFEKWRHRQAQWPQVPQDAPNTPSSQRSKQLNSIRTKGKQIVATLL